MPPIIDNERGVLDCMKLIIISFRQGVNWNYKPEQLEEEYFINVQF